MRTLELSKLDIKQGSNILGEFEALLEQMSPRVPGTLWIYVDQLPYIQGGIRGALRRVGRPEGVTHKVYEADIKTASVDCELRYKGIVVRTQIGRYSSTAKAIEGLTAEDSDQ